MGNNISEQKSIAGLRANAAAFIVNLSFFMGLGLLIPIFALILEDKNNFVRAYSKQTLAITVLTLVSFLLNFIIFIGNLAFFIIFILFFYFNAKGNNRHPLCNPSLSKHFFEIKLKLAF